MSIATVVRFKINFSHLFPPGTDAGYYPLQTRHWLAHGHLMYDDLPLIFWIDAGLAKALMMCGWDGDAAVLLASRLVDCALPPWAAAFVMALGYRWSGGRLSALAGCASAAVSTVLWQPSMVMLSEFQKNALGLVWMVAAVAACSEAMRYGGCRRWGAVAGVMSVSALTHVGAFAATGLALIPALVVWAFLRLSREPGRSVWSVLGPVGFVGCGLVMLIALKAPKRAADLIAAPTTIFHDASWGLGYTSIASTFVVVAIVVAIGVRCVWGERHRQLDGDAAIVIGSAIAATVLAAPRAFSGCT